MSPKLHEYIKNNLTSAISRNKELREELIMLTSDMDTNSSISERIYILNGGSKPVCGNGNSYKWNTNAKKYVGCGSLSTCKCALENKKNNLQHTLKNDLFSKLVKYVKTLDPNVFVKDNFIENDNIKIFYYSFSDIKDKNFCRDLLGKKRTVIIFEDELSTKQDIVFSRLKYIFSKSRIYVGARKTEVKFIDSVKDFLNETHIQGNCAAKYKIGAFYNGELVAVMTFGNQRVFTNMKSKDNCYELIRYASKYNIPGIASKMFKFFKNNVKVENIISYCDLRWGTGNVYEQLGFTKANDVHLGYWYVKNGKRFHRYKFRKSELVKQGYDKNKSEREIMTELGYSVVWDCGCSKYYM